MLSRTSLRNTSAFTFMTAIGLGFVAWSGTQVYVLFCAPAGFTGFFQSLVTMDSSPCQAVFHLIAHSQMMYSVTIASLVCALISFLGSLCAVDRETCPPCPPCVASAHIKKDN